MKKTIFLFIFIIFPIFTRAQVVINEIGWAGTKASATDEWIELYNNSDNSINLEGWILRAKDNAPQINLSGEIKPYDFYLIERTSDTTISDVVADFYGSFGKNGNISNNGEDLELLNLSGAVIDKVYFSAEGWPGGEASPDYISIERVSALKDGLDKENWRTNNKTKINGKDAAGNNIFGTPKAENSASSEEVVPELPKENKNENSEKSEIKTEENPPIFFKESKIESYAGRDKLGIAGADIEFYGTVFDLKGEKINSDKIRYIWNFGDGASSEGKSVKHSYFFPGLYIAVLDSVFLEDSASDRILVKIIPNEILISEVSSKGSWIELYNGSDKTLDISFWQIAHNGQKFIFPKNSFIKEKQYITVSKSVSNIIIDGNKDKEISLLYPNGSVVQKFIMSGSVYTKQSFSLINNKVQIGDETPGEKNKKTVFSINQNQKNYFKKTLTAVKLKLNNLNKNLKLKLINEIIIKK